MNHLIIIANPSSTSYNAAIKDTIIQQVKKYKQEVKTRDLYKLNFNPVLQQEEIANFQMKIYQPDVLFEQQQIEWADVIYLIYPTWWYSMPAILKGYCDRVLSHGFAFSSTPNGPLGLLKGKKVFIFETAGDTEQSIDKRHLMPSMKHTIDLGILDYCGFEVLQHKVMTDIHNISEKQRQNYLKEIQIAIEQQINL